jgi:Ca2+-binding EF-hand superfamily protein
VAPRPISHLLQEQGFLTIVQDWKGVFRHFDHDGSGTIDGQELRSALNQFGYNLSPQLLSLVQRKYDVKGSAPQAGGYHAHAQLPGITFDRFVRACVVVKQITEKFAALDTDRDGWVQINYESFLQTVLTLP